MKKILAILLVISSLLCLASCAGGGAGADTDAHDHSTTASETKAPETTKAPAYDNALLNENGMLNFTPSDYRIVDKTDFGYVIIRLSGTNVYRMHKVIEYETTQDAIDFLIKITKEGTAKDYPELGQVGNYFYYTIGADDETYGKFMSMPREEVLKAFGRDSETTASETDADGHRH